MYSREEAEALSRELEKPTAKEINYLAAAEQISSLMKGRPKPKGIPQSEEHIANMKAAISDPEIREKHRLATMAAMNSPEIKAKMDAGNAVKRGVQQPVERVAKIKATTNDPEFKKKHVELTRAAMNTPEMKAKIDAGNAKKRRPCTVDGVTIFPSRAALILALGKGKAGDRNPNFKYVEQL